jgi:hypothetical protein
MNLHDAFTLLLSKRSFPKYASHEFCMICNGSSHFIEIYKFQSDEWFISIGSYCEEHTPKGYDISVIKTSQIMSEEFKRFREIIMTLEE